MKKIYGFLCLCVCMILTSMSVYAADEFSDVDIYYDRETGVVGISGTAEFSRNPDEPVRLLVLKPNTDVDKFISGEVSFETCGVYADETSLTEKAFTFDDFTMPSTYPAGKYIVRIVTDSKVYSGVINLATEAQALSLMNNAASGTAKELVETYNEVYGFEIGEGSAFSTLEENYKNNVYERLEGKAYANKQALSQEFLLAVNLEKIAQGPFGAVADIISQYASQLNLNLANYNRLSNDQKDNVCKKLARKTYTDVSALQTAIDGYVTDELNYRPSGNSGSSGSSSSGVVVVTPNTQTQKSESTVIFTDLNNHAWAKDSVEKLYNKGIISGKSDKAFAPDDLLTRAEAVKIITLAFFKVNPDAECNFVDVPKNNWAYPYIATLSELGIVNGYSDNVSGANDNITREDLSVMIIRAAEKAGVKLNTGETVEFKDADKISPYAKDAVSALSAAGIINGMGNGEFAPKNNATRAQAAKIVAGLI